MSELQKPATIKALTFLKAWPSYPTLTAIWTDTTTGEKGRIETQAFPPGADGNVDLRAVMQWIDARQGKANLYFCVNSTREPKNKKAEKTDIASLVALHVDVDVHVGEDQEAGIARIIKAFHEYKIPPTVITSSGGGAQAFWLLKEPFANPHPFPECDPIPDTKGKPTNPEYIKAMEFRLAWAEDAKLYNIAIERDLAGDNCHNIDRIMRLPGTINIPNEVKIKKGRKPALAYLVEGHADRCYAISDFAKASGDKQAGNDNASDELKAEKTEIVINWTKAAEYAQEYATKLPAELPVKCRTILEHAGSIEELRVALRGADLLGDAKLPGWPAVTHMLAGALNVCGKFTTDQMAGMLSCDRPCNSHGDWKSIKNKVADPSVQRHIIRSLEKAHAPDPAKPKAEGDWPGGFDDNGYPLNNYANVKYGILKLGITCQLDEFRMKETMEGHDEPSLNGQISDRGISRMRDRLEARFKFYPQKEHAQEAVTNLCTENKYNPVIEYFADLKWDGTPRLATMLHTYLGADDTPLNAAYGRKFMCAVVRRSKQLGCKWDHQLVVQGAQGKRKSMFVEDLAVFPDLYTDAGVAGSSIKESMEISIGRQIIEIPEMAGHSQSTREKTKAHITRKIDSARMAYAHYAIDAPRSSVTVATINEGGYLNDPTGERRYWHVSMVAYNRDAFLRDRDQLYAEAVALEPDEKLWLDTPELERYHDAVIATVKEPNEFADMLASRNFKGSWWPRTHSKKLADGAHIKWYGELRVSSTAVRDALGLSQTDALRLRGIGKQIADAMLALGWVKGTHTARTSHRKGVQPSTYYFQRLPDWLGPILEDWGAVDEIEPAQSEVPF
jgi:hypothetical protein